MGATGIGAGTIPGTPFGGAVDPSSIQLKEGFQVIPSVAVGQRYDSNVYFVPKTPNLDRADYVTTTVPQIRGLYAGDLFVVNAAASAIGEYYAKNTNLNYVGTNTAGAVDLSKLFDRWWHGSTVRIADTYMYTPQAPAFVVGDFSGTSTNPFATGFQVGRVNASVNNLMVDLAAPINQTVSVTGSYMNGFLRYGTSDAPQAGTLISSSYQTYMAGLAFKVSPQDTLSVNSVNTEVNFQPASTGSYSTHGGTVGWEHAFNPNVTFRSHAGAQVLEGTFSGVTMAPVTAPLGDLALLWRDRTTTMALSYSIGVSPSFQFQSQSIRTQVVGLTLMQQTAIPELSGVLNVNYGRGDPYGNSSGGGISYVSAGGTAGLVYRFSPKTFLGVNYSYMNFDNKFSGTTFAFDRHVVQFSLTQAFF